MRELKKRFKIKAKPGVKYPVKPRGQIQFGSGGEEPKSPPAEPTNPPEEKKPDEEDEENIKFEEPIKGLLGKKELAAEDEMFAVDYVDKLMSIPNMLGHELKQVALDLKTQEMEEILKAEKKIIKACSKKYPDMDAEFYEWSRRTRKLYAIKSADLKSEVHRLRKYEPKPKEDPNKPKTGDQSPGSPKSPKSLKSPKSKSPEPKSPNIDKQT